MNTQLSTANLHVGGISWARLADMLRMITQLKCTNTTM